MVKASYVDKNGLKKGAWSEEEDNKLRAYILRYGHWNWRLLPKYAGLERCGKSCRLRWMNYLKPGIKRGSFTRAEEDLVVKLHDEIGNRWSAIAAKLPGRTDNDIKNFWHTHLKRSRKSGRFRARVFQEERASETTHGKDFQTALAGGDGVTSPAGPMLCSQKEEKSEGSSAIYILESSSPSSSSRSSMMNHQEKSVEQNLGENYDSGSSSDSFSGFEESFWTEPFMVDTSYDVQGFGFSPQLSCFDDNGISMFM